MSFHSTNVTEHLAYANHCTHHVITPHNDYPSATTTVPRHRKHGKPQGLNLIYLLWFLVTWVQIHTHQTLKLVLKAMEPGLFHLDAEFLLLM